MAINTEGNKDSCYNTFPGLKNDKQFNITSPIDHSYNCLAWATQKKDVFMWPFNPMLDGCAWPHHDESTELHNLFEFYKGFGFSECDTWEFDAKFIKISLYHIDGQFTHAARQLRSGLWTSKLGSSWDISHDTPFSIEGSVYGKVGGFMAKKFN
jgi:hypothetical protein